MNLSKEKIIIDCAWLKDQYLVKKRTATSIGKEVGLGHVPIIKRLRKLGIPIRDSHGINQNVAYRTKEWLEEQYTIQGKTEEQLGEETGIGQPNIHRLMVKHKIPRRSRSNVGEKNGRWCGGKSFEPYCVAFTRKLKESVRDDFNRSCYLCESLENGEKLSVHHVDYQKSQGCKGQKWSLIPLCRPCHVKTNYKRWYWFALLRDYWIYEYIDFTNFNILL